MDRELQADRASIRFPPKAAFRSRLQPSFEKVEKIIATAIKRVYLKAEKPTMTAVTEEVYLQCFKKKIKHKPAPNTIRARIPALSDRVRLEKREGKKRAAEKYEPIKGQLPRR